MTIKQRMLTLIFLLMILPALVTPVVVSSVYERILERKVDQTSQQNLSQIVSGLETVIGNIVAASTILANDRELKAILQKPATSGGENWKDVENVRLVQTKMDNVLNTVLLSYTSSILLMDFSGHTYTSQVVAKMPPVADLRGTRWYQDTLSASGSILWTVPGNSEFSFMTDKSAYPVAVSRTITDDVTGVCGVLVMTLDTRKGWPMSGSGAEDAAKVVILNRDDGVVYPPPDASGQWQYPETLFRNRFHGTQGSEMLSVRGVKTYTNYVTIPRNGWRVLMLIPYERLMKETDTVRRWVMVFNVVQAVVLLLIALGIATDISGPLHRMGKLMKRVSGGDFSVRMPPARRSNKEVRQVTDSFNAMVLEMERLLTERQNAVEAREQARIEALQAQINPHFLLNTLNSIRWMATLNGAENVSQMLIALSALLDVTLYHKDELVPLALELECTEHYVSLQKMRFGDSFHLRFEIQEGAGNLLVPMMILQPLVENSIIHGFRQMEMTGEIVICAVCSGDTLTLCVRDNGRGLSQDILDRMDHLQDGEALKDLPFSRIGVKNVRDRLVLRFGDAGGMQIRPAEGGGTEVRLRMPCRKDSWDHRMTGEGRTCSDA